MSEQIIEIKNPSRVIISTDVRVEEIIDPANQPPTVSAGSPQVVTFGMVATLSGSASDPDGTIVSYLWSKINGPAGGVIVNPKESITGVHSLPIGLHTFALEVTDNKGEKRSALTNVEIKPAIVIPPPAGLTLVYERNFDTKDQLSADQLGRGAISTTVVKSGAGSFRSEVRGSDPSISSGYRSEQQYDGNLYNPKEGVIEYDAFYENWKSVSGGGHSVQWHPHSSGGSAVLSLQNYGGKFNVVRSLRGNNFHQGGTLKTTEPNRWYKLRWEIKWSTSSDGYIKLFIDGELYYSFTGVTEDGSGVYLKLGQNRWLMSAGQDTVVYYDNLKIFKRA